jgi:hypothetical protein
VSDLQCPATVLVLRGDLAVGELAGHRIAAVVATEARTAAAERLAGAVGAPVVRRELGGDPVAAIEELADLHRGETLLLVAGTEIAEEVVTRALGRAVARVVQEQPLVELAVDADGWALRPGPPVTPDETGPQMRDWGPE